jgi:hypothetical protein
VRDLVILAEDATEITGGKEDRTRSSGPRYGRFFAEVEAMVSNYGFVSCAAETALAA